MRIVLFKNGYSYCDFMCKDLFRYDYVTILNPIDLKSKILKRILLKILKYINTELYSKYFLKMYIGDSISINEEICFVSFDSSPTAHIDFSTVVKKFYPNSLGALIVYNSIEDNEVKVNNYSNKFDIVFTFDPYDAKKYGWIHFLGLMPSSIKPCKEKKIFDFVFIGNDKGRYRFIKEIYMKLTEMGYKCYFYVISKRIPKDSFDLNLLNNKMMSFNEVIQIEAKAKCILDFTSVGNQKQGLSLRILEAIYCNAKIITNNYFASEVAAIKNNVVFFDSISDLKSMDSFLNTPANYNITSEFGFATILSKINEAFYNLEGNTYCEQNSKSY